MLYILGWISVGLYGDVTIREGIGASLGLGIFLALPMSALVSAVAWLLGALSLRTPRGVARTILCVAIAVEFIASASLNLAWTLNAPVITIIDLLIAAALTGILVRVHSRY